MNTAQIYIGDCREVLRTLPDESVHCCVTSPPYFGLRDYGVGGQIGLETTPEAFVEALVGVFAEVRRVLRKDGTLWLNLGDSYANDGKWGGYTGGKHAPGVHGTLVGRQRKYTGLKAKDLIGIPWEVALAIRSEGWFLRSELIWHKPNAMPEPVQDRPTKAHETIFLLSKSLRYFYDGEAIAEDAIKGAAGSQFHTGKTAVHQLGRASAKERVEDGTRNKRSVWSVATAPFADAHFATFPPALIEPCILAGCPEGGTVLDPFNGAGTTGLVALKRGRNYVGIELNPDYAEMSRRRIEQDAPLYNRVEIVCPKVAA